MQVLNGLNDDNLSALLGLDRDNDYGEAEREHPDILAAVFTQPGNIPVGSCLSQEAIEKIQKGDWIGQANRLSVDHRPWDIIDAVAEETWKAIADSTPASPFPPFEERDAWLNSNLPVRQQRITARQIIRQRRSAVAFDGVTGMTRDVFYKTLAQTVQRSV